MTMSLKISNRILAGAVLMMCVSIGAHAQAYISSTPYSIYGIGELSQPGTAYNRSMGGVGVASRNNRFINILNPAAVTARDSLAFMVDFSLSGDNKLFKQGDMTTGSNTFNINNCIISFPLWSTSAMMVGVVPYSGTGYETGFDYTDPIIGNTGNISYKASGQGSIYTAFAAAGITFWDRLSLGAQFNYYFGDIEKYYNTTFSDASYNSIKNGKDVQLTGTAGKFGLQYEQPLSKKLTLGIGATYTTKAKLKGYIENYSYSSGSAATDTLSYSIDSLGVNSNARLSSEIAVGVSLKYADKWRAEFDYTRSDWNRSGFNDFASLGISDRFSTSVAESYRFGFEYVPNRNDIRYYLNKVAYCGGLYHKREYYTLDSNEITATGITIGATFPINKWYNGLTVGVDFGKRGSTKNNLIRENYINFSVGINIFDIWFQKSRYQ